MNSLKTAEIQNICLCLLKAFDDYTRKENLTYWLSGGTLLGAVRHEGFIPWDDDVDVMMPRPDYNRLIEGWNDGAIVLSSCERDQSYCTAFARLWDSRTRLQWELTREKEIGCFIDIFPIDEYPSNRILAKIHQYRLKWAKAKTNISIRRAFRSGKRCVALKRTLKHVYRKSGNHYARVQSDLGKSIPYEESRMVGVTTTTEHMFRERNSGELYEDTVFLPFENMSLPAPIGYDEYLRHLYGDYMTLPPENQRRSVHSFKVYRVDDASQQEGKGI